MAEVFGKREGITGSKTDTNGLAILVETIHVDRIGHSYPDVISAGRGNNGGAIGEMGG